MSKQIAVARVNATGALIRLNPNNRALLNNPRVTESKAEMVDGKLVEIDGSDYTSLVTSSNDLIRIGQALLNNRDQREKLLTAALRIPEAESYLQTLGVYDAKDDSQYIDPDSLVSISDGLNAASKARAVGSVDRIDDPDDPDLKQDKPDDAKSKATGKKASAAKPSKAEMEDI